MPLKIVGAGFGRTGTLSLKNALEKLGFGPCYHMLEVMEKPDHLEMWHRLAFGGPMDWDLLFKDFQSAVDWPAARYWRELVDHYPQAKVLLSVRDADAWYKSVTDTIYRGMTMRLPDSVPETRRKQMAMSRKIVLEDTFEALRGQGSRNRGLQPLQPGRARDHRPGPPAGLRREGGMGAAVPVSRRSATRRAIPAA